MAGNSEFIEVLSPSAIQDVKTLLSLLDTGVQKVNDINAAARVIKLPSQAKHSIQDLSKEAVNNSKIMQVQQRLIQQVADAQKAEAIEVAKLRVELSNLNKENKKQAQEALGVMNAYQKLNAELNQLRYDAKGLAADMFLLEQAGEQNSQQYKELANTYENVSQRVLLLDGGLKRIDSRLGQSQRFVGNYERGWNGLGNAINQLTREAPAFSVSMNTGFLAISNNLPILVDEINNLNKANKDLIAQGKPTVNVLKSVASAIFSWPTLFSAAITALTLFGSKLWDMATNAKAAVKELDLLTQAQERYQDTIVETATSTERQLTNVNRLIAVMKDETKGIEERTAAAKELQGLYPGYLKNLTEEELTLDRNKQQSEAYRKAIKQLTSDIKERVDAESKQAKARENLKIAAEIEQEVAVRKRANAAAKEAINNYGLESAAAESVLERIREQIKARQELTEEDQEFISKFGQIGISETGSVSGIGLYVESQITELELQAQALRREYENQAQLTNDVIQKTSLLDFKPDDDGAKDMGYEDLADFEASRYELIKTRLENEAEANKRILEDEENGYADREAANKRYGEILRELAERRVNENIRLLEKETADRKAELDRQVKDEKITLTNANAVKRSLDKQLLYDRQTAYEQFSQEIIDANKEVEENLKSVFDNISQQERENKIAQAQIDNLRQIALLYDNIGSSSDNASFAKIENNLRKIGAIEQDNAIAEMQAKKGVIQVEIDKLKQQEKSTENNEAINKLLSEQLALDNQILSVETKRKEEVANLHRQMKEATRDYLDSYSQGFLEESGLGSIGKIFDEVTYQVINDLGEIETKTGSTFDKLYDQAQTTGEKIGVVFTTMTDVMTQAFEFSRQNMQARYDAEYAIAERQRDVTLEFYTQSEAGRAEVERQYEEKRREIRIREAKAQKEQALFNAIINTAQAVVAALPNIPLSVIVGALGAAQIAMIASRPIPAYAEGIFGDESHPGGAMLVNDGRHREVVVTPDGKVTRPSGRNVLMTAPKGTQVFPNESVFQKELDGLLSQNSIAPFAATLLRDTYGAINMSAGGGLTREDALWAFSTALGSMQVVNNTIDENGFGQHLRKGNARTQNLNAVKSSKGITLR